MTVLYSGFIFLGVLLSIYNWFYLQEVETAKNRMGFALPRRVISLFRGVFFACLVASCSAVLTLFAALMSIK